VHEAGLKVETTLDLDSRKQPIAPSPTASPSTSAARLGGSKRAGKLENVLAAALPSRTTSIPIGHEIRPGDYVHAVVTRVLPLEIRAVSAQPKLPSRRRLDLDRPALRRRARQPGDIIYVHLADAIDGTVRRATLEQDSGAEASLLASTTPRRRARHGGGAITRSRSSTRNPGERQVGSVSSPTLHRGYEAGAKPTDIIVDGPVSFGSYTPHNYENDYKGAMTSSTPSPSRATFRSQARDRVGIQKVIEVAHRFGVTSPFPLPAIAIGAVEITLQEQVASYSVFQRRLARHPAPHSQGRERDGITLWSSRRRE